ncbi:MAG: M3 family metallopeptidase [Bacteroidales bacterium]|jgi:peptidyl-dipeptidase Dcp|nr:M3 family metallopeptidase [Bacteroidales bacterium]
MNSGNPLLQLPDNKFEAPQFDKINTEHFKPAFEEAIARGKRDIESITENSEEPSFKNTIELLEFAGSDLTNISTLFFNLNEANTSDLMQQIALEISPVLSEYSNDIMLNERLFKRVKSVYDNRGTLNLTKEELRLTEECYKGFARNGANLMGDKRDEFRMINTELSQLTLKFGQNLLAATNKFTLHITDKSMLDGLPQFVIDTGAEEAKERSLEGWLFTLHAPSYVPFMQYSNRRELREEMWRAFNSRSLYDQFDNREIVRRIVELRLQRANLLGYSTHAQYVLENNMAGTPQKVESFLDDLLAKTLPFAKKEIDEIQLYAAQNGFGEKIMPWDFGFWSEKYKSEKYSVNDQLLKPYFRLESVRDALFSLAGTLFGLKFISNSTLPVYHPDVKVYEVYDSEGDFISLLYLDYFPRASKRGGAWMTSFREQSIKSGIERRPLVSLVCNFTKPTTESPSLLTFNEVSTLLHEFGHALHGMLARGSYPSLTGTNVVRDFVELPSQIMENWATEGEFLKSFAVHYKTGETIPDHLIEKIIKARNFLSGYSNVRQLTFGINDMAWHNLITIEQVDDVVQFEKRAIKRAQIFPDVESVSISASFGHIFSGGYSAGYYSYKWAEVLEADAFSLFKERGIFCKKVAASFRDNILSKGNLEDAATLYRNFRGREPRADALLEKFGLITSPPSLL